MPVSSFFSGLQRFAGQALGQAQKDYGKIDRSLGGWLPGGVASPISNIRKQVENTAKEAILSGSGSLMNTLPDRANLFARYMTGVGNRNLELDPSTLKDLRESTTAYPTVPVKTTFVEERPGGKEHTFIAQVRAAGPGLPQSGPVNPYGYTVSGPENPTSVTNTLGRFMATVDPKQKTIRMQDKYDMINKSEDPDLVSGKIQPAKAWNEIESIWNPAAMSRNSPNKIPGFISPPNTDYSVENVKKGLSMSGESPTFSPATRFARALMYMSPIKPQAYDVDIQVPLMGEIK
jgi:hypothetical protein